MPVEAAIIDHGDLPIYLKITGKAKHLRDLGMSDRTIARALGVSDKTARKPQGGARTLGPDGAPPKKDRS